MLKGLVGRRNDRLRPSDTSHPGDPMKFATKATPQALESIADAKRSVFWLDRPERPEPEPSLEADISTDLVVIGGGFTGLWAAL
ncbi:MAG: hypothetical protein EBY51_06045, partial [Actinobacteria bacterium]|nr:hypothetical protein [Actinomycetota bacterium]